ncbi:MAG: M20 family metallopeptidase [Actinobacteria bacterium]|nr:MAG: M20 family metallopeptidase [Actinomycetota bacterium]
MAARGEKEEADRKATAQRELDAQLTGLVDLSHTIHSHPEVAFEEERAAAWVGESLAAGGFEVENGVCDLPTALIATAGSGPMVVAVCAEYDALPGIGHACGHNVIAASAVGTGLALAPIADDLGVTIKVIGTPAEEGGGGKIYMLERGAFEGIDAAMMVHPGPAELIQMPCLAVSHFDVHYTGREAHASAFPEAGLNAADALTVAQVGIGLLRQQFRSQDQVHGIVTKGGEAPNVIPAHTSAKYYVRAATLEALETLEARVRRCFEAGALATGTEVGFDQRSPRYSEFVPHTGMQVQYRQNAEALGRTFPETPKEVMLASTDMANVSLAVPSIHPMLDIDSSPAVNHQPEFAAAAITPAADQAVRDGALAMAWTVVDLATDDALRSELAGSGA